jgi:nucleoside-triphosphatase THEP1
MSTTITTRLGLDHGIEVPVFTISGTVTGVVTRRGLGGGFYLVDLEDDTQVQVVQVGTVAPRIGSALVVDAVRRSDGVYRVARP